MPLKAAVELGKLRWKGKSKEEIRAAASAAAQSRWARMTEPEKSAEMSRRRKLGHKRKKKAA